MARRFITDRHEKAHLALESWACWIIRYVDSNALDVSGTDYSRDRIGGPKGPIIPDVMSPKEVLETQKAYDNQTSIVQYNIRCYYGLIPKTDKIWRQTTKDQRSYFLKKIATELYA